MPRFDPRGVLYQNETQRNPRIVYGRFSLPAFDAWVYVAMAENPSVFTVAPWGYRWLSPAVASVLPTRTVTAGFRVLTVGALALAGVLLHLYLRRVGARPWMAALAVLAFVFSTSVGDIVRYRYLVDPLTVALWIALLWAVESVAPVGVVALLAVLGFCRSGVVLLGIPQLLVRGGGVDRRARIVRFGIVLAAALLARFVLHRAWPAAPSTGSTLGPSFAWSAAGEIAASWREWIGPLALGGLLPLTIAMLLRPVARAYASRNAYLILATLALPFAAAAYTGKPARDFSVRHHTSSRLRLAGMLGSSQWASAERRRGRVPLESAAPRRNIVGLGCRSLVSASWRPRRYRRETWGERGTVLSFSLRAARACASVDLEHGRPYEYDFERQGLPHYGDEPARLGEARWFLREGFGDREQRATGVAVLHDPVANLLVPVLTSRDVAMTLTFVTPMASPVSVAVNGKEIGELRLGSEAPREPHVARPQPLRGDNVISTAAHPTYLRRSVDCRTLRAAASLRGLAFATHGPRSGVTRLVYAQFPPPAGQWVRQPDPVWAGPQTSPRSSCRDAFPTSAQIS